MQPIRDPRIQARARMTFELYDTAEQMMRQNIRRRYPGLSADEVEAHLERWLLKDPAFDITSLGNDSPP